MTRFGGALVPLVLILAAFFWRPIFLGEIVYPHDNDRELGILAETDADSSIDRLSNRKFSDQSSQYIPELHHQLQGESARWISTWNPHVELGRPTAHLGGSSKAFWLTHALSVLSSDAHRIYTWLVMFAISGAVFFALLLFRAEGLHPAASFAGALGIGLGVYMAYWATFALFLFGVTWTLAWLWLIRRTLDEWDPLAILGIVIVVQALLLTAYPQQIVWHVWLVGVYTLCAAARRAGGLRGCWPRLAWIAIASIVGVITTAPVYLDLFIDATRSSRLDVPAEFFLASLPRVENVGDALQQVLQMIDAGLFGNPILSTRPLVFNGFSLTPIIAFGLAASFLGGGFRRLWPLHLFAGFALLATYVPGIYAFGIDHLGLSLSRFTPSTAALIPIAILSAHGFDRVLRSTSRALALGVAFAATLIGLMFIAVLQPSSSISAWSAATSATAILLLVVFSDRGSTWLLMALATASVFVYAQPLLLVRSPQDVHHDSPLVEALRRSSEDGSRFAWIDQWIIPANQEALLGLRSIHSYNSLSSEAYQDWVQRISEKGATMHGRYFSSIEGTSKLSSVDLQRANVGVLIARQRLDPALAEPIGRWGRLWIHRTRGLPIRAEQTADWRIDDEGDATLGERAKGDLSAVQEIESANDRSVFRVEAREGPTLLWVSRQFHPSWRARSDGRDLETMVVDGIYLGAKVPAGSTVVEFDFEPYVRWAWIPQVLLIAAIPGCVVWRRRRARSVVLEHLSDSRISN